MTLFPILAPAAFLFHHRIELPITGLIGTFCAVGAAVTVIRCFLGFMRNQITSQGRMIAEFQRFHAESQRTFQEQLDRISDRQRVSQQDFQSQVARMTESQNVVLRDAITAMRCIENTLEESGTTISGMEKTLGSLTLTVQSVDILLFDDADAGGLEAKPFALSRSNSS